jgi:hypothetical protein
MDWTSIDQHGAEGPEALQAKVSIFPEKRSRPVFPPITRVPKGVW